jgi:cholesterol transport system auxiliary component
MSAVGRRGVALGLALSLVPIWGCSLLSPAHVDVRTAVLDSVPREVPQGRAGAATLLVFAPETNPVYDTTRMAYTTQSHEIAYFRDHEWAETPSQMLHPLLVRTLQGTHAFDAVQMPPHVGRTSHALHTDIVELVQDFTGTLPMLRLVLRVQLSDGASGRLIATHEIRVSEPMREKAPHAGVVGANEACAKALLEVARFVLDKTASSA